MSLTERTEMLIGKDSIEKLIKAKVLIFGVGGVGGYVVEALARAGVGELHIVDNDTVSESNINRQIIATYDTIGQSKVKVMEQRIHAINPECKVKTFECFYLPENEKIVKQFAFEQYDYVVDAIDTVSAKIDIIKRVKKAGTRIISCMGTGNKLNPSAFEIADISKTSVCPLAKVIRKELRRHEITDVKVLYSKEEPIKTGARIPGSISFVPSVAGLFIAGEVIKDLL